MFLFSDEKKNISASFRIFHSLLFLSLLVLLLFIYLFMFFNWRSQQTFFFLMSANSISQHFNLFKFYIRKSISIRTVFICLDPYPLHHIFSSRRKRKARGKNGGWNLIHYWKTRAYFSFCHQKLHIWPNEFFGFFLYLCVSISIFNISTSFPQEKWQ